MMQFLFADFIPRHRFDTILVSARWKPEDIDDLRVTAEALKPYADRVVVIGPHVEYKHDLPRLMIASMLKHDPTVVDRFRTIQQRQTDRIFAEKLSRSAVGYVSLYRTICPDDRCQVTDQGG